MSLPRIATAAEHVAARKELLRREKELTRLRDELNTARRNLPMVEVVKDYRFEGRPQLIVYHFMFDPSWDEGCPSCTAGTEEISQGFLDHLHTRGTTYAMVSRAPLAKLERWKADRGWSIPWYSSDDGDFTYDFGVTLDLARGSDTYNFRTRAEYLALGESFVEPGKTAELPGRSCFLQADGRVFHTYSQYARGLESAGGSYYFLDLTAFGRQEDWEQPKGRADAVRGAVPDFAS